MKKLGVVLTVLLLLSACSFEINEVDENEEQPTHSFEIKNEEE